MHRTTTHTEQITVRPATYADSRALLRLAALDSARVPDGRLVVAEIAGELVAAVPVAGGRAIADPFHRTAALVEMLELRAAQIRATQDVLPSGLAERIRGALTITRALPRRA